MSCGACANPVRPRQNRRRITPLLVAAYLAAVGSSLYLHLGLGWSPWVMAPALFVLAHAAVFGIVALVGARLVRSGDGSARGAHDHDRREALILSPRLYDRFLRVATLGRENRLRLKVLTLARLKPGDALLDVGCGTGTHLLLAAPIVGASGGLCGVEPSRPMAEHARAKGRAHGVRLEIHESTAGELPLADASFDAVLCSMVLHHLPESERAAAAAEMHRVLRSGGRVVVADVRRPRALSALFSIVSLAHLRAPHPLMDAREICDLLARAGFVEIKQQAGRGAIAVVAALRA